MIKVAEIERIRYAHFREGLSLRELSRTFHHSRKTIRKALEDPGPWSYRRLATRPAPVMDAVAEVIQLWLAEDLDRPRKQRHTAHRIKREKSVARPPHGCGRNRQVPARRQPSDLTSILTSIALDDPGCCWTSDSRNRSKSNTPGVVGRQKAIRVQAARAYCTMPRPPSTGVETTGPCPGFAYGTGL